MVVSKLHRKALAMIELIFAIVIMGLALMSAPRLISQAQTGGLAVVKQEAIAACATEVGMIMTRAWDEADTNESDYAPILVVEEDITALNETTYADGNGTGKRIGIPQSASRSFLTSSGQRLNASSIANEDVDEYDDIDDFNGYTTTLSSESTTSTEQGDYIDDSLTMTTTVNYISTNTTPDDEYKSETVNYNSPFSNSATITTNVKFISTNIVSGSHSDVLDTNITLKAFMCNIGTYTLKRRTF